MTETHVEPVIAILVANGFEETYITAVQRAFTKAQTAFKMIAPEQGLVNGWQNNGWGHCFTVDELIGTALGSDYDALLLIGGERGVAKLKSNPHTRRIVNHFLEAQKPIAAIEQGVSLLALSPKSAGLTVCAPAVLADELKAAQMVLTDEVAPQIQDGLVLTADGTDLDRWVADVEAMIAAIPAEAAQEAA